MRKVLGIVGGLIGVLLLVVLGLFFFGSRRLSAAPAVEGSPVQVPSDAEAIARGERLATISSCNGCHGSNLEGEVFLDEAPIGYVPAPNLTSGAGGVGGDYSAEAWELAIRHGVAADGRTLVAMPSNHYASYGDDDLGDLIAYLQQAPAQNNDVGPRQMMAPGNIIFGVLAYGGWSVNLVDHAAVGGNAPEVSDSAEYGKYILDITSCGSCHAENLAGNYGQLDAPQGPNLTTLARDWDYAQFAAAVRAGLGSDGAQLDPIMPWQKYAKMTDTEVEALWTYLGTLAPLENNTP